MSIKVYNPKTSGRRKSSVIDYSVLTKIRPVKKLLKIKKKTGGRSNTGKITVRHRGGGTKRFIRIVDFKRDRFDQMAKVIALEYDPNRSAFLARIQYPSGELSYILAPGELQVNDTVVSSQKRREIKPGNRYPLAEIPVGSFVYNIELTPGKGGQLVRSGGGSAQLMSPEGPYAQLKLPSAEIRLVSKESMASIGELSNPDHRHIRYGKAGRKRHLGIRPTVRGKAMNPVDHPHGGGEGNQPIGLKKPKTPWGKAALGVKTRKKYKTSNNLIIQRRKK
jgi:large subunit ribosomal protein L2